VQIQAFLNELSLTPVESRLAGRVMMEEFIGCLISLPKQVNIRSLDELDAFPLCSDYVIAQWRNDLEVDLELRRRYKSLEVNRPFFEDGPESDRLLGAEFSLDGAGCQAATAAYLGEGICLSWLSHERWDTNRLDGLFFELNDEQTEPRPESVPHASRKAHVSSFSEWLTERLKVTIRSGRDIWENRATLYPGLEFCESSQQQIELLQVSAALAVNKKLTQLSKVCQAWLVGPFPHEQLGHASTESTTTLQQYGEAREATDANGVVHQFSHHLRYTPGAGRLYYQPLGPQRVLIGYIGKHLPTRLYH
jgi:hypothetical protein